MQRKLVVGNWKMHGSRAANARPYGADVAVCVPFPYLTETAATLAGSDLRWGAQDVSAHEQGAYTGEVSAAMLAECGCRYAIVGHSERRAYHAESDQLVAEKAQAALARGVTPVVCVGETLAEREAGHTGRAASMRILYGGSVKPDNAATLFTQPDIDGGLIGGASLKAADFIAICRAAG